LTRRPGGDLSAAASTSASASVEAFTLSIRPDRPCVPWFHASMPASVASSWWTTHTGASATVTRSASVMTSATSMIRSESGLSPVISRSIQISRLASCGMKRSRKMKSAILA